MNPVPETSQPEPGEGGTTKPTAASSPPEKPLTPEEQMALYEDALKETDWGHQPC